jgi:hypothetical protein
MDLHKHAVGDVVRWVPRGCGEAREGQVVAVVPAGRSAYIYLPVGTCMSALHGAPMSPQEDRYLVAAETPHKGVAYLAPPCAEVDVPRQATREAGRAAVRARAKLAAGGAAQVRRAGPRRRCYAARYG